MAKNRFSNQKPVNYSRSFRWGVSEYDERRPVKKPLTEQQIANLRFLFCFKLTTWESNFVNTAIVRNLELSEKQSDICSQILKKYKVKL
jgi:hypothetical protein